MFTRSADSRWDSQVVSRIVVVVKSGGAAVPSRYLGLWSFVASANAATASSSIVYSLVAVVGNDGWGWITPEIVPSSTSRRPGGRQLSGGMPQWEGQEANISSFRTPIEACDWADFHSPSSRTNTPV